MFNKILIAILLLSQSASSVYFGPEFPGSDKHASICNSITSLGNPNDSMFEDDKPGHFVVHALIPIVTSLQVIRGFMTPTQALLFSATVSTLFSLGWEVYITSRLTEGVVTNVCSIPDIIANTLGLCTGLLISGAFMKTFPVRPNS